NLGGWLLRLLYGVRFTDLSPFRAIRRDALQELGMGEATYGWNLEMLMRAAAAGLPAEEIAVGQRRRIGGGSKVSGDPLAGIQATGNLAANYARPSLRLKRESRAEALPMP